jgi:hypothetical protein
MAEFGEMSLSFPYLFAFDNYCPRMSGQSGVGRSGIGIRYGSVGFVPGPGLFRLANLVHRIAGIRWSIGSNRLESRADATVCTQTQSFTSSAADDIVLQDAAAVAHGRGTHRTRRCFLDWLLR